MKPDGCPTARPFTVAVCTGCTTSAVSSLVPTLAGVIGDCPHGVLVVTGCLLSGLTCATRRREHGVILMLQPCTADRRPIGPAKWIGPVATESDLRAACDWITDGSWHSQTLSPRLRADVNLTRAARRN